MQGRRVIASATVVGVAGLALLGYETVRALRNDVLGSSGTALLFGGFGLVVLAGLLAIVSLGAEPARPPAPLVSPPPTRVAAKPVAPEPVAPDPAVVDLRVTPTPEPAPAPPRSPAPTSSPAPSRPPAPAPTSALATLRGGSATTRAGDPEVIGGDRPILSPGAADRVAAEDAAGWTELCQADGAGRLEGGSLSTSVRRGATLIAYREGVLVGIGKASRHQSWAQITTITATLGGKQASISVRFTNGAGLAEATFTGRNGDLAPVATALVSAAPAGVVTVSYG